MDCVSPTARRSISVLAVSALCASAFLVHAIPAALAQATPTCKGRTATVWVSGGVIMGGEDDGDTYTGTLNGTMGDDVIVGTTGVDSIDASMGDDVVCGSGGNDEIKGENGDDILCGDDGQDTLDGGIGDDILCGDDGDDVIEAGIGNDKIDGGAGSDTIDGEIGTDQCVNGETVNGCESTSGLVDCSGVHSSSSSSSTSSTSSSSTTSASSMSSSSSSVATSSSSSSISSSSSESSSSSSVSSSSSSIGISMCPATNLLAHWKFDENSGIIAFDAAGSHHGVLQNGPSYVAGAPAVSPNVSALDFDGSDDHVLALGSEFDFGMDSFTVSAFLKTTAGDRAVLGHTEYPGTGVRGWGLSLGAGNTLTFFGNGAAGNNATAHSAPVLNGAWHHVSGVYSRSGSTLQIAVFVDGTLVGTSSAMVGDIGSTAPLMIGTYASGIPFDGTLDDVRVYNRALSASEVASCAGVGASSSSSVSSSSSSSSSVSSTPGSSSSLSSSSTPGTTSGGGGGQTFGISVPDDSGAAGAYRGKRTNTLTGVAQYLAGMILSGVLHSNGDVAPAAFGGAAGVPLSTQEIDLICSMRRSMPKNVTGTMIEWTATHLSGIMNRSPRILEDALRSTTLCVKKEVSSAQKVPTLSVLKVDAAGYPVSKNPTWNSCIMGKVTLADIKANPDRDEHGNPRDCSYYHTSGLWKHPDLSVYFKWDRMSREIEVPAGVVVQRDHTLVQR